MTIPLNRRKANELAPCLLRLASRLEGNSRNARRIRQGAFYTIVHCFSQPFRPEGDDDIAASTAR
jgi:hypothetical protein